jgi:hypothetical protein
MNVRLTTIAAAAFLTGCAGTSPYHDAQFGQSGRMLRAQQLIDPDAPSRNTSRGTTDGKNMAGVYKVFIERTGYLVKEPSPPAPPAREVVVFPSSGNNQ